MKKSAVGLIALMFTMILSPSSHAEELEIRSTGGAYLGKLKFSEIDPTDALLDVGRADRSLIGVRAGRIGSGTYREFWRFENSYIGYDRAPARKFFRSGRFNERSAARRLCGENVEQNCDDIKSEKLSKNLIVTTYQQRGTGAACGGLNYIDEDRSSGRHVQVYGNYTVIISTCLPVTNDHEQALALSAHYLSLIKKDGRPIARLSRYDLPEPKKPSEVPSKQGTQDSAFGTAPDNRVCNMATGNGAWQQQRSLQKWVVEARERGLTLKDCERVLKAK